MFPEFSRLTIIAPANELVGVFSYIFFTSRSVIGKTFGFQFEGAVNVSQSDNPEAETFKGISQDSIADLQAKLAKEGSTSK
mmetsp:Transcript_32591/g.36954  ORF Transcript_32591/g.36954 Transcript_32591/m.36954 type:complete len:81 (-) Transcript_32591:402-644(-)